MFFNMMGRFRDVMHLNRVSIVASFVETRVDAFRHDSLYPDCGLNPFERCASKYLMQSVSERFFGLRLVSLHALHAAHLLGESVRYRDLPTLAGSLSLRNGHSRIGGQEQHRLHRGEARPMRLLRARQNPRAESMKSVCGKGLHRRDRSGSLCPGDTSAVTPRMASFP